MDPRETHRCPPAGATTGARLRGPLEVGDGPDSASQPRRRGRRMAHAIAADEASGVSEEGSLSKTVTLSGPLRTRRPRRRAAAWDERPRSRVRRTAGGDPCGAGPPGRRDPPASTCDGGSRAAWPSSGCWADRCASLTSSSTGDCRVTLGHPGASRARSMYLDARDELWHTSAPLLHNAQPFGHAKQGVSLALRVEGGPGNVKEPFLRSRPPRASAGSGRCAPQSVLRAPGGALRRPVDSCTAPSSCAVLGGRW